MAQQGNVEQLSERDLIVVLNLLRNSSTPMTLTQLVSALKQRPGR